MKTKKGIRLIERYLEAGEIEKVKKVSIKFKESKFAVFTSLFKKNTKRYFLKVTFTDKSERLIPISELEKETVKQSVTAFNFMLHTATVSK